MRSAPSVTYPVGRCVLYGQLLALCCAAVASGLLMLWWWVSSIPATVAAPAGLAWVVWSALAYRSWRRQAVGRLQWDGLATAVASERTGLWRWMPRDAGVMELHRLEWVLDAQTVVLLRLHGPQRPSAWLWLQARDEPARWADLRRALTAHT